MKQADSSLRALLILCSIAGCMLELPSPVNAQRFTTPTREELEMTTDPRAPGASAVFLYREEVVDNKTHYRSTYARIKVFTEKGKEWGTVQVPFEPGVDAEPIIEARTIHRDGTVISVKGKAADLLVIKAQGLHLKTAVFNMPNVEIGSILEYQWTVPMTRVRAAGDEASYFIAAEKAAGSARWDVQQELFVHKAHFYFQPSNPFGEVSLGAIEPSPARWMKIWSSGYLLYKERLPAGVHVVPSISKDYTLDVVDIPPIHHEEHSPPLDDLRYRVWFYLTPDTVTATFWSKERERWLSELNGFAVPSPELKAAANAIVAAAETPEAKARKLYDAVQELTNRSFLPRGAEATGQQPVKTLRDVWRNKSGDRNDLAALYLAMARSTGLEAYAMQVADRSRRVFDPNYLTLIQLDALLIVIRLDGKDVYLDPGEKMCPFGQLKWTHTLSGGLREDNKAIAYTPGLRPGDAITARNADLAVEGSGAVTGKISFLITGSNALRWRQEFLTSDPEEVKRQLVQSLASTLPQGAVAELRSVYGLDSSATSLSGVLEVSGQIGTATRERLLLPAVLFSSASSGLFRQSEKREAAIDLHFPEQLIDDVIYKLPAGYQLENSPKASQIPWPPHAVLAIETVQREGQLEVKRAFTRGFALLDPKDYPAMADYAATLERASQQEIVLTRTRSSTN